LGVVASQQTNNTSISSATIFITTDILLLD
jgi:hypothetical protein